MDRQNKIGDTGKKRYLALFDFDGTITTKDSFFEFLRYTTSTKELTMAAIKLAPTLLKYWLGQIENGAAKEIIFSYFFSGWEKKKFHTLANTFSLTMLPQIIKETASEKINWHKTHGHEVVVVSASFEAYLRPWCDSNSIQLIGTTIEEAEHQITGRFLTKNCSGKEKVARIKARYNLNGYDQIYAYGDSQGDMEMLGIADESHFKPFT